MTLTNDPIRTSAAVTPPSARQQFLDAYRRESATTLRVLRAYPPAEAAMRPHETSNSALQLAWTFAVENALVEAALKNELRIPPAFPPMPESWTAAVQAYEEGVGRVTALIESVTDEAFGETVQWFTAPKTIGDIPKLDFARFMLNDAIHHRGQLSVYLRMTGSRVPSIYGPSGDEKWF